MRNIFCENWSNCSKVEVVGYTDKTKTGCLFHKPTRVGPKFSGLTYKSRAKWKMLRGIYRAICGEFNVSVCVEIKGDCIEKWHKVVLFLSP